MKKTIIGLFILIFCMIPSAVTAAEIEKIMPETEGLCLSVNKQASGVLSDEVELKNFMGKTVYLQRYDKASKGWIDECEYSTENPDGTITIQYPDFWKKHAITKWRLYAPESEESQEYISKTVNITAKNIKKASFVSKSVCIIDAKTGDVIYGKNPERKRENASTTKMMTALLVMEKGNMQSKVKISRKAAYTGYRNLWMNVGDRYYADRLFRAMLVSSSNDASTALAEYVGGSASSFSKMMNKRAKSLGCTGTHFVNPHGLPNKKHYSTAKDLCLIQRECIKHSIYKSTLKKKSYSFRNVSGSRKHKVYATDKLLGISGFEGGKTGWTGAAGNCFCGVYSYKENTYIFCTLGCYVPRGTLWKDSKACMKYIRDTY